MAAATVTSVVAGGNLAHLYKASPREVALVEVPAAGFVMIDGRGDPNTSADYRNAIEALYAVSYGLKFALKKELGLEHRVGPLEGLWWAADMAAFGLAQKASWSWTMMVAQPDAVTPGHFARVRDEVGARKALPALALARLERFEEGLCAQIMHVGPFSAEGPTIARLHAYIAGRGWVFDGRRQKHHEIYLSDVRRAAPAKWRTIVRQPVARA